MFIQVSGKWVKNKRCFKAPRTQDPKLRGRIQNISPQCLQSIDLPALLPSPADTNMSTTGLHFLQDIKLFSIYRAAESLVWWVYINHRKGQQERWQEEQFQRPRFGKHTYVKVNIRPEQVRMSEHGRKLLLLTICYEGKNYILKTHTPLNIPKIYNSQ